MISRIVPSSSSTALSIAVRSGYRSPELNRFGNENRLNCARNTHPLECHIWDRGQGDDRIAGQHHRKQLSDGPVNYIHREDATNIIEKIIHSECHSEIFNAVAPEHPLRSVLYESNARKYGFFKPDFRGFEQRIISPQKLADELNYQFVRPDPMKFWS